MICTVRGESPASSFSPAASTSLFGPLRVNRRRPRRTPQEYRGDLDPGEQRNDEQVVSHARQQEQQDRYYPRGQSVAGVAPPAGIRLEPPPQRELGGQEGEDEHHEGRVVD